MCYLFMCKIGRKKISQLFFPLWLFVWTHLVFRASLQLGRWSCTRTRRSPTASTLWTISWWCTTRQTTRTTAAHRVGSAGSRWECNLQTWSQFTARWIHSSRPSLQLSDAASRLSVLLLRRGQGVFLQSTLGQGELKLLGTSQVVCGI